MEDKIKKILESRTMKGRNYEDGYYGWSDYYRLLHHITKPSVHWYLRNTSLFYIKDRGEVYTVSINKI